MAKAINGRKRWTQEDDAQLVELYTTGVSMPTICKSMGRTESAIGNRVHRLDAGRQGKYVARKPLLPKQSDMFDAKRTKPAEYQPDLFGADESSPAAQFAADLVTLADQTVEELGKAKDYITRPIDDDFYKDGGTWDKHFTYGSMFMAGLVAGFLLTLLIGGGA